jgi:hypothetical protein
MCSYLPGWAWTSSILSFFSEIVLFDYFIVEIEWSVYLSAIISMFVPTERRRVRFRIELNFFYFESVWGKRFWWVNFRVWFCVDLLRVYWFFIWLFRILGWVFWRLLEFNFLFFLYFGLGSTWLWFSLPFYTYSGFPFLICSLLDPWSGFGLFVRRLRELCPACWF